MTMLWSCIRAPRLARLYFGGHCVPPRQKPGREIPSDVRPLSELLCRRSRFRTNMGAGWSLPRCIALTGIPAVRPADGW